MSRRCFLGFAATLLTLMASAGLSQIATAREPPSTALVNGKWFDDKVFALRTVYSVHGRFTLKKPARLDGTLDLAGTWIVPPFGEAHNHNIGTGMEEREKKVIQKYLADGIFYVKIQGNLPITEDTKRSLSLNQRGGVDVAFAQGSLTASGGHPIALVERLLPQGYFPGYSKETLKDHRYFTLDSDADLEKKWSLVMKTRPDFIKTFLWFSDEFEKRKDDEAYVGQKGLDPRLLPKIVDKAHRNHVRVSTHVTNAADFHNALAAGVDEITHIPLSGLIAMDDARLAAARGVVVITTCVVLQKLRAAILPTEPAAEFMKRQLANLKLLMENGVALAIGSDNVADSSVLEFESLAAMGVFDSVALLKMWTETTARTIFPERRIGELTEGYEASFLALAGDPIEDSRNVRKIRIRFKQGFRLPEQ